jgi:DDE superfamily endonuclease
MANAQVGVFLAYASAQGAAFIDRALYLPRSWTRDPPRRAGAHVPKGLHFATKIVLAQRMLARAFAARVPARFRHGRFGVWAVARLPAVVRTARSGLRRDGPQNDGRGV